MSEEVTNSVIDVSANLQEVQFEYVYVTIPAEYICVYHRILAMLADYGEEMLKDCKATCKDRNSGVIECFNMFNAAVAARKLGKDSLAEVLIKYIKTKINQIYKGKDNSTSFVFPVDENGQLKAFVSCGERPRFFINPDDGELYEHKFDNGFDEHFRLGEEDEPVIDTTPDVNIESPFGGGPRLQVVLVPRYEKQGNEYKPCADIYVWYDGVLIDPSKADIDYYFDGVPVIRFNDVVDLEEGLHTFSCVVNYKNSTDVGEVSINYEIERR